MTEGSVGTARALSVCMRRPATMTAHAVASVLLATAAGSACAPRDPITFVVQEGDVAGFYESAGGEPIGLGPALARFTGPHNYARQEIRIE